ncbi:DUF2256 domain-containing protein [Thalassospira sp. HF15]|uniref:DUF2256 domain-containing protein n=1 Tax=Thalassospira sp. HF15 TaxID=2722755 RepID=UPI001431A168|nr:DUF2256 domain-containing protein [Thalassospira sp. HF15]NIY74136.1 DUF2256 domain-containing protein [Thalassospira sp. HF15]
MPKNANGHRHSKSDLPQKTCVMCARPFNWRRKWKDCWNEVQYCSDRCRRQRKQPAKTNLQDQSS